VKGEALHIVAELSERSGRRSAGETRTYDDDLVLTLVGGINEFTVGNMVFPLFNEWTFRNLGIEYHR
jgi:hypothetical protein